MEEFELESGIQVFGSCSFQQNGKMFIAGGDSTSDTNGEWNYERQMTPFLEPMGLLYKIWLPKICFGCSGLVLFSVVLFSKL